MSILVQCPNPDCKASSMVEDSISGRNVKCKRCGKPFVAKPTFDGHKGDTRKNQPATSTNPFPVLPAEFGRYRILRQLGCGGMGAVYLAQDTHLGRQVALKVPFFDAAESPQRVERFVREARSAAVLQHPNICTVFDAGQIDGRPFITMAYIDGTPLEAEIDPDAPMPQRRAAEIVRKIALALQHAHLTGIVHRDLKPANVMMAAGDEPVVMDFGLAKRVADVDPNEAKLTRDGGLLGTPSYMAPEQVKGDSAAIGPTTDVYALGVILFEMLTGRTPYIGGMTVVIGQILAAPVPPVQEFRPDVDSRLDAICRKAMAKAPADRFASMTELADALGHYLKTLSPSPLALPLPPALPLWLAETIPPLPRPVPPPATVLKAAPPAVGRSPFDDLEDATPPTPASKKAKRGQVVTARLSRKKWPIIAGVAVGLLLAALAVLWSAGVFKLKTQDGTIVLENLPADAEVLVDGEKVALKLKGDDKPIEIQVAPGKRKLEIKTAGFKMETQEVTLASGERKPIGIRLEPLAAAPEKPAPPTLPKEETPDLDPDRKAAEYVLSVGSLARVNDEDRDIRVATDLPKEPFRLTYVDLARNPKVNDTGLAAFKGCRNLTTLYLFETGPVSDIGLANFKDCKNLMTLHLQDQGQVSNAGLIHFMGCRNLKSLVLSSTRVNDEGLEYFKGCKDLTYLKVARTQVSDAGLANFRDCKNLTALELAFTKVTDEGLANFKECKQLRELRLSGTQMTDKGLAYFKGCDNLDCLYQAGSKVTKAGLDDFRKALPKCSIDPP
jgi:predicted Zn finger-like uncharacterized protein